MNAVERAVVLARSDYLAGDDFPIIQSILPKDEVIFQEAASINLEGDLSLEEVEKTTILKTLEAAHGNKSETARRLGITRKTLHKKLKAYGVMP